MNKLIHIYFRKINFTIISLFKAISVGARMCKNFVSMDFTKYFTETNRTVKIIIIILLEQKIVYKFDL